MALSEKHVSTVCQRGKGESTCRFLGNTNGDWVCLKLTSFRRLIDQRVDNSAMRARGDNCNGIRE